MPPRTPQVPHETRQALVDAAKHNSGATGMANGQFRLIVPYLGSKSGGKLASRAKRVANYEHAPPHVPSDIPPRRYKSDRLIHEERAVVLAGETHQPAIQISISLPPPQRHRRNPTEKTTRDVDDGGGKGIDGHAHFYEENGGRCAAAAAKRTGLQLTFWESRYRAHSVLSARPPQE